MKKIVNEITLLCTDIVEVKDCVVDTITQIRKNPENHRELAESIKAEYGLDNVTVDKCQVFVTEGKTIEESPSEYKVRHEMDWLQRSMHGHFDGAINLTTNAILKVVRDLEEENARLREELGKNA